MIYEVDELAGIVAMANEKEQEALTNDIKMNGQSEPAVLWQGRIVDGRCRQLACITLGIDLKVRELDSKLTREEVAKIVKSLNTRRNLTMTQKIISAVKEQERTNESNAVVAKQWAIGIATLKNGKYIAKHRPDFIEALFNGNSVKLVDTETGFEITSNKVNTIARLIKKQQEQNVVEDTSEVIEFSVDAQIKTEMGKNWYYGIVNSVNFSDKASEQILKMLLVEMANLKFKGVEDVSK